MKRFTSDSQKTGLLGEELSVEYLKSKGFTILERNYTKKIGEIDIVARKTGKLYFIEVKTLIKYGLNYNPFENITRYKLQKITRTALWYLAEKKVSKSIPYCINAIAVEVTRETRSAKLSALWNITQDSLY
jgi:putative endonuclease